MFPRGVLQGKMLECSLTTTEERFQQILSSSHSVGFEFLEKLWAQTVTTDSAVFIWIDDGSPSKLASFTSVTLNVWLVSCVLKSPTCRLITAQVCGELAQLLFLSLNANRGFVNEAGERSSSPSALHRPEKTERCLFFFSFFFVKVTSYCNHWYTSVITYYWSLVWPCLDLCTLLYI